MHKISRAEEKTKNKNTQFNEASIRFEMKIERFRATELPYYTYTYIYIYIYRCSRCRKWEVYILELYTQRFRLPPDSYFPSIGKWKLLKHNEFAPNVFPFCVFPGSWMWFSPMCKTQCGNTLHMHNVMKPGIKYACLLRCFSFSRLVYTDSAFVSNLHINTISIFDFPKKFIVSRTDK